MIDGLALQVVRNFPEVSEVQIAQLEQQVLMAAPNSLERHLLYALRVSSCVPRLRNLGPLVSRWKIARGGAGSVGLDAAKSSPYWTTVCEFLRKLYADRFRELAEQTVITAIEKAAKRKSDALRQKALDKALATVVDAGNAVGSDLPGIHEDIQAYTDRIERCRST